MVSCRRVQRLASMWLFLTGELMSIGTAQCCMALKSLLSAEPALSPSRRKPVYLRNRPRFTQTAWFTEACRSRQTLS